MKVLCFTILIFIIATPAFGVLLIVNKLKTRALELSLLSPSNCKIYNDSEDIKRVMSNFPFFTYEAQQAESIDMLFKICENVFKRSSQNIGFIYPGTKWCGPGNIAKSYSDLGVYKKEDSCCREHDHCTRFLETGQCTDKLCNTSPYTRSHCDCDTQFQQCLNKVNSPTAHTIGNLFFNIAKMVCFKERCLFGNCTEQFQITPNFNQKGWKRQRMTTDKMFKIFAKVVTDFLQFA
ncbi:phospholipase A2 hemilipin-like isoform X1 [Daktulosphaira vitifoliae]|uniref:phospholipase A2 hemilipin-like isoform X1 n=1 Tax=Daktulosphaira vitifoliae TaxID=58002 RepID=UPI0021AA3FC8|nr:phospholipase A2 hemilipin-like isoform X1 [Daktulosphaira vitifoliae]